MVSSATCRFAAPKAGLLVELTATSCLGGHCCRELPRSRKGGLCCIVFCLHPQPYTEDAILTRPALHPSARRCWSSPQGKKSILPCPSVSPSQVDGAPICKSKQPQQPKTGPRSPGVGTRIQHNSRILAVHPPWATRSMGLPSLSWFHPSPHFLLSHTQLAQDLLTWWPCCHCWTDTAAWEFSLQFCTFATALGPCSELAWMGPTQAVDFAVSQNLQLNAISPDSWCLSF